VNYGTSKECILQIKLILPGCTAEQYIPVLREKIIANNCKVQERTYKNFCRILHHVQQSGSVGGSEHQCLAVYESGWVLKRRVAMLQSFCNPAIPLTCSDAIRNTGTDSNTIADRCDRNNA
jgi:hypothetical protein